MTKHSTFTEFAARLREFIQRHAANPGAEDVASTNHESTDQFNELALALFSLQFDHLAPYRRLCESRGIRPGTVRAWSEIPALPAAAFKEFVLSSLPEAQRTTVFHSSGTTVQRPGRHFHSAESLQIYEASLLPWFGRHLMSELLDAAEDRRQDFVALTPDPLSAPHSSLVHMFDSVRRQFGSGQSFFAGSVGSDGAWVLEVRRVWRSLESAVQTQRPVTILGTAFSFLHLLDHLAQSHLNGALPTGSSLLETGGYKGRSRVLPKAELHGRITESLGISDSRIVSEYGMSELGSQAYDQVAGHTAGSRVFRFPAWARARIVSPENGEEVREGEAGLICVFDLANVWSAMAIQTEDLGVRRGEGFELIGRATAAEPRGCSLMAA